MANKRTVKDPFPEYQEWSSPKFFSFLRSGLRAKWSRWPPKYEALRLVRRPYTGTNTRQKHEFQCATCNAWFPQKQVSVDHIEPAGTLRSFEDLPLFCERLFVGVDKLQVLCDECHRIKTAQERAADKEKKDECKRIVSDSDPDKPSRPNRTKSPRKTAGRSTRGSRR